MTQLSEKLFGIFIHFFLQPQQEKMKSLEAYLNEESFEFSWNRYLNKYIDARLVLNNNLSHERLRAIRKSAQELWTLSSSSKTLLRTLEIIPRFSLFSCPTAKRFRLGKNVLSPFGHLMKSFWFILLMLSVLKLIVHIYSRSLLCSCHRSLYHRVVLNMRLLSITVLLTLSLSIIFYP